MLAIYKRELKGYFTGMIGYVFIAFVLVFIGIYTTAYNFKYAYPSFEYVISSCSFLYVIAVPVLTMRVFAEERKQKTDQLLYTLPVPLSSIVLAKYLAVVTVLLIPTVIISFYPLILTQFGEVELLTAYSSIAGFFFLGCALLAVGIFASSLVENQLIAAVITLLILVVLLMITGIVGLLETTALSSLIALACVAVLLAVLAKLMTKSWTTGITAGILTLAPLMAIYYYSPSLLEGAFADALGALAVFDMLDNFTNGIFDLTSIVFYLSVAGLFVFFSFQSIEKRRWS